MGLIGFLFRFASLLVLLAAVVTATLDAVQSVSSSSVALTSLGNGWINLDPESLVIAETSADANFGPQMWKTYVAPVLGLPACAVFFAISLLLWIAGYQEARVSSRHSFSK